MDIHEIRLTGCVFMTSCSETRAQRPSASEAPAAQLIVSESDSCAIKKVENSHARAMHKQERGWVGVVCGTRGEKSGNIAFLVIVACFILIIVSLCWSGLTDPFFTLLSPLVGVIGLALGYLFGAHNKQ